MPNVEQVLNNPLSGAEVRRIVLNKLESSLAGDTRLADYVAYPSFSFRLDLALVLTGSVSGQEQHHIITGGVGKVDDDPANPAQVITAHVEQDHMPPNEARVEAGLGVPVLTRDARGREITREVKYGKEQIRRAKGQ